MKKLSNLEQLFHDLNDIPRTRQQKQFSFNKIMYALHKDGNKKRNLLPKFLTFSFSIAACFLFLFIIYFETEIFKSDQLSASLDGKEITQMWLTPSKSANSFIPNKEERQQNIITMNDKSVNEIISNMIKNANSVSSRPISEPKYDLMIALDNDDELKIKVWVEGETLYIKELSDKKYYFISEKNSVAFLENVNIMKENIDLFP
ncbi:hypothetical protein KDN24_21040 [Bacillus sp. Bva_UNVM-123]|uniref:hypothetical protein n=1 Tax=Bacillus sp. Bva_UNVM-123 TaxID=2829798 RepID=UPI00391FBBC9